MNAGQTIQVEVFRYVLGEAGTIDSYSLPARCHRVLVDQMRQPIPVWGFTKDGNGNEVQVEGELVDSVPLVLFG